MALTIGRAPFTSPLGGTYNFDLESAAPKHILYLEKVSKRIRGLLAGETIIDTREAMMLHETGEFIQWYIPMKDVLQAALEPSGQRESDVFKGEKSYYGVRVGDRFEADAAWSHRDPPQGPSALRDLVAFDFDRLDAWFEEDEEIFDHPRDPYHRFDCRRTSEPIVVRVGGEKIAETRRAIILFETSGVPRYYIPLDDVKAAALSPSETRTICPYKGGAAYYNVRGGEVTVPDGAWTLPDPFGEAIVVLGHLSFWGDNTEIYADGRHVPL